MGTGDDEEVLAADGQVDERGLGLQRAQAHEMWARRVAAEGGGRASQERVPDLTRNIGYAEEGTRNRRATSTRSSPYYALVVEGGTLGTRMESTADAAMETNSKLPSFSPVYPQDTPRPSRAPASRAARARRCGRTTPCLL